MFFDFNKKPNKRLSNSQRFSKLFYGLYQAPVTKKWEATSPTYYFKVAMSEAVASDVDATTLNEKVKELMLSNINNGTFNMTLPGFKGRVQVTIGDCDTDRLTK